MSSLSSSFPGMRPPLTSSPSMNREGVIITPRSSMASMSSTFTTSASTPSSCTAFSTSLYSFLHFAHPVPNISILMLSPPLVIDVPGT